MIYDILKTMRFFWYTITFAATAFFAMQAWNLYGQKRDLERGLAEVMRKMTPVAEENAKLEENLSKLEDPAAIGRELRKAGYAAPGEKVFVIVPKR